MEQLTLDEIREEAIQIIKSHPTGIRQSALISELQEIFIDRLVASTDPKVKIRNAVWNLETKSDEVTKQSVGPREVIFLPVLDDITSAKNDLLEQYIELTESRMEYKRKQALFRLVTGSGKSGTLTQYPTSAIAKGKMLNVWYYLTKIEDVISEAVEKKLFEFTPAELAELDTTEIETIFAMKQGVEAFRKARTLTYKQKEE